MKIFVLLLFFTLFSCEDFSIFEKDQEDISFYNNTRTVQDEFSGQLLVGTFNIKFGYCQTCDPFSGEIGGGYQQLNRIANLINSLDLDIVSLQEVGLDYDSTLIQNQAAYLASKTNMNFAYGTDRAIQNFGTLFLNGFWGNAILSKYKIVHLENPTIRYLDYYNQNHSLKATIKLNEETEIIVLNSHFAAGSTDDEKNNQIRKIKNLVKQEKQPYIFTGDLNIPYQSDFNLLSTLNQNFTNSLEQISETERVAILNSGTFIRGSVLDYIFTDKTNFTIQSGKLAPIKSRDISDHYLYYVKMTKI
ncbi:endonuclease/exonuclease/phosphatase family protein [Aquimarina sp. ERC-38]|uniref:endonuclease/exonuclease/phosphatase family protein n=1 Tax=Aquimarina sp. ERC-38 TaxID=2949996 RepID=UPI0022476368|nr:endonuclease/exonuclease/phosphatase family protein [Aquimarina sp. ERC-38]UZO79608.1 endonuclease/exonuclease/phosphatase family protein [Aquimarina sp. ERC-38]